MAKINGIEIKALKTFKDHEGCTIARGTIYLNGKKLGDWSQDYMNGPDNYDFDERVCEDAVKRYGTSEFVDAKYKKFFDLDLLLYDLLGLIDDEKAYKKGAKQGFPTYVVASDGFHTRGYYSPIENAEVVKKDRYHSDFLRQCEAKFFKDWNPNSTKIYTCLNDFIINV